MKVLIINGHPRDHRLSTAFEKAYADGAIEAGASVEILKLGHLTQL